MDKHICWGYFLDAMLSANHIAMMQQRHKEKSLTCWMGKSFGLIPQPVSVFRPCLEAVMSDELVPLPQLLHHLLLRCLIRCFALRWS